MLKFIYRSLKYFTRQCVLWLLILMFCLGGLIAGILHDIYLELPSLDIPRLNPSLSTRIYDRHGNLLHTTRGRTARRRLINLSDIPSHVKLAFTSIEDQRFFSHFGIDFRRILGALIIDLKVRRLAHGASTITQQLVRNVYLSHEKTITRKIKEIMLALKLEYSLTKTEILEMYLNTVYFGGSYYGLAAASKGYFNVEPRDLSVAQASLLAAILKAPNRYSPRNNFDKAMKRRRTVLFKMRELDVINEASYQAALREEITVKPAQTQSFSQETKAPYFTSQVVRELVRMLGWRKVLTGGYRVITTLDSEIHAIARKAFLGASLFKTNPLSTTPDLQGAFVVREVDSGEVVSLIGGRDYKLSSFNRATQARRQPGSCFKPFVYAAAFENGVPPNLILNDEPLSFFVKKLNKEWTPENYGGIYHGPSILRTALEHSYNMIAIKLLDKIGLKPTIELAQKAGIHSPMDANLTLALGSTEVTPLELVGAYSTFANQGIFSQSRFILRIEDRNGKVVYESKAIENEAMNSESAYQTLSMMRSVVTHGSGQRANVKGLEIAGKTGTNQDYIDAWFVGLTPELAALVTFGYNDRKSLGLKTPSSKVAAPVVGDFFKKLVSQKPSIFQRRLLDLKPPGMKHRSICRTSGLLARPSCPGKTKEIFSEKQIPQIGCPIHSTVGSTALIDG